MVYNINIRPAGETVVSVDYFKYHSTDVIKNIKVAFAADTWKIDIYEIYED